MNDATLFGISTAWIIANVWSLLTALVVLAAGWFLAKIVSRQVATLLSQKLKRDVTIGPLVGQVIRYAVLFVTIIVVLGQFGVQTASILAVLGAAGLAVALALQGTLSNIAAGIMLLFLRPFNVGDYIDAEGTVGTVVEVGLFATILRTQEGVFLFAPNSKLSNARIINYTREPSRIVEMKFTVPRNADLARVRAALAEGLNSAHMPANAKPEVLVDTLGDSSVTLAVRVPVRSQDWTQARSDLQEKLRAILDDANGFVSAAA
ncbi:small conductance mechanosensitive channel [Devosia sp. YR412]|uniref:mechanosensitive ion channel family protein n=1 Tax=Devosia sp. YR412 TaxID=1881030 RepID=UPI0008C8F278|nr:mechanosensitive ion channel family protein [Devosia sp. YR412]SEP99806.1 small conductance mechanosensitive channel [Devosia sp. YR412]